MLTALDPTTTDQSLLTQQTQPTVTDPGQFAAQLAQLMAANTQAAATPASQSTSGESSSQAAAAQLMDPTAILAGQVAQIQSNLTAQAASQPQPTADQVSALHQNIFLQSLNLQASQALSHRNVAAFVDIETMIGQQLAAMNPSGQTTSGTTSNATATTSTATASSTIAQTASNASTISAATAQAVSNASTISAVTAQAASNAGTTTSVPADVASNAGAISSLIAQLVSNAGATGDSFNRERTSVALEELDAFFHKIESTVRGNTAHASRSRQHHHRATV